MNPNPANKDVIICCDENMYAFNKLALYNTFGRLILKQVMPDEGKVQIPLTQLCSGMYLIQVTDVTGKSKIKKFLVQRE